MDKSIILALDEESMKKAITYVLEEITEETDIKDVPLIYWQPQEGVVIYQDGIVQETQDKVLEILLEGIDNEDHPYYQDFKDLSFRFYKELEFNGLMKEQINTLFLTCVPHLIIVEYQEIKSNFEEDDELW